MRWFLLFVCNTGVHPQIIVKSLRKAAQMSIKRINEISVKITKSDKQEQRQLLEKCAQTTLSSKLVAQHKEYFAKLVVDAVMLLDDLLPLNMIGIKKAIRENLCSEISSRHADSRNSFFVDTRWRPGRLSSYLWCGLQEDFFLCWL
jgi:hypothetical protein